MNIRCHLDISIAKFLCSKSEKEEKTNKTFIFIFILIMQVIFSWLTRESTILESNIYVLTKLKVRTAYPFPPSKRIVYKEAFVVLFR